MSASTYISPPPPCLPPPTPLHPPTPPPGIKYLTNTTVTALDASAKTLTTNTGDAIPYDKLILATGARPIDLRQFNTPGADLSGIYYLRDVVDADKLLEGVAAAKAGGNKVCFCVFFVWKKGGERDFQMDTNKQTITLISPPHTCTTITNTNTHPQLPHSTPTPTTQAVIVGGGYIGMEVAAALSLHGLDITMVFPESRLMERFFTPQMASFYEDVYTGKGIKLIKGELVTGFVGKEGKVGWAPYIHTHKKKTPTHTRHTHIHGTHHHTPPHPP